MVSKMWKIKYLRIMLICCWFLSSSVHFQMASTATTKPLDYLVGSTIESYMQSNLIQMDSVHHIPKSIMPWEISFLGTAVQALTIDLASKGKGQLVIFVGDFERIGPNQTLSTALFDMNSRTFSPFMEGPVSNPYSAAT